MLSLVAKSVLAGRSSPDRSPTELHRADGRHASLSSFRFLEVLLMSLEDSDDGTPTPRYPGSATWSSTSHSYTSPLGAVMLECASAVSPVTGISNG